MDDAYGHPNLLGLPNNAMAKVLGNLDIPNQFSLRLVCQKFHNLLPIQLHCLQLIFSPKYAQIHFQDCRGKMCSIEYDLLQDAWGPCVFVRRIESPNFKKLGPGNVGHHLARFLGGLLANPNFVLGGIRIDFSSTLRPLLEDPRPHIQEMLTVLQEKMNNNPLREGPFPLEHLILEYVPPALVPLAVTLFASRQMALSCGMEDVRLDEVVQTDSWRALKQVELAKMEAVPPMAHFGLMRAVIITVPHVSRDDLLSIRMAFYDYPLFDMFRMFCATLTFEAILDAFGTDDQQSLDFGLLSWPIQNTDGDILFVSFSMGMRCVEFSRSRGKELVPVL